MNRKPIICITIHRRYSELSKNLLECRNYLDIFDVKPDIVLISAQPEYDGICFFNKLKRDGLIDHILYRPSNGLDGPATSYPESRNIRLGLSFCKDVYGENSYVILQTADIKPNKTGYKIINEHMKGDGIGVLFHCDCFSVKTNIWYTNFFAVSLKDENIWPPIVDNGEPDILERVWGKNLSSKEYPGNWLKTHNSNNKRFIHEHLPISGPPKLDELVAQVKKKVVWWKRLFGVKS